MKRSSVIAMSVGLCGITQSMGCNDDSKTGVTLDASTLDASEDVDASTVDASADVDASTVDASEDVDASAVDASEDVDASTVDASADVDAQTVDASQDVDAQIVGMTDPPNYSDPAYWRRQSPSNGYGPAIWEEPGVPMHADVFFLYPTTFFAAPADPEHTNPTDPKNKPSSWNQTFAQARVDPGIEAQVYSKAGVFALAGTNVYAPLYRQAAGNYILPALLWNQNDANIQAATNALAIAYGDIKLAFLHYLNVLNPESATGHRRPFILAGHSQGSNLLLMLLKDKDFTPELRSQMVAAYVIGWSVTSDDISGTQWEDHGICNDPKQTRCIVTYNTQQKAGDFSQARLSPESRDGGSAATPPQGIVRQNAYSVNPLSWVANGPKDSDTGFNMGITDETGGLAPNTLNLGARFFRLNAVRPGHYACAYDLRPQLGPSTAPLCAKIPNDQVPCCANSQPVPPPAPGAVEPTWSADTIGGWRAFHYDLINFTGAQNMQGALVVDPNSFGGGEVGNYKNLNPPYNTNDNPTGVNAADLKNQPPGWYHNYDYGFFWMNLEENASERIQAFH